MDRRLIELYDRELQYLRLRSAGMALYRPKTARMLGLGPGGDDECADPHVERLLEGVAYLAARVHRKLEAQFPEFVQGILETAYPDFVAPFPSVGILKLEPAERTAVELTNGPRIDDKLRFLARVVVDPSTASAQSETECVFRITRPIRIWPLKIASVEYVGRDLPLLNPPPAAGDARAAVVIEFSTVGSVRLEQLGDLDELELYLSGLGASAQAPRVFQEILGRSLRACWIESESGESFSPDIKLFPLGYDLDEAVLKGGGSTFHGYTLLREFFAFPQRFMFIKAVGLQQALRGCKGRRFKLIVPLTVRDDTLAPLFRADQFSLNCVPVANLFETSTQPVEIDPGRREVELVIDSERRLEHEVIRVLAVNGQGRLRTQVRAFESFFLPPRLNERAAGGRYSVRREPRDPSPDEVEENRVPGYLGDDVFVSLVEPENAPFGADLRTMTAEVLASNRHLPMRISGDRTVRPERELPVSKVAWVVGPLEPRPAPLGDELLWRTLSHFSVNHLSLIGGPADGRKRDAAVLREILKVYIHPSRAPQGIGGGEVRRWVGAVEEIAAEPVTIPKQEKGRTVGVRGLKVSLYCNEDALKEVGWYLFGSALEQFMGRFASVNSFIQVSLWWAGMQADEKVYQWPPRTGQRVSL